MKKFLFSIIAVIGLTTVVSCSDMLEVDNQSMLVDPDLNQKTDSVFYAYGIAQSMQQLADQYFFIGEMRGDLDTITTSTDANLKKLYDYTADASNKYDSAYVYYKVINNCNYYLAHRDTTLYTGSNNVTINEYSSIAAWRAWAYLQLARTYGDNIPFYTEPLTAISQIDEDKLPKYSIDEIVNALAPELEKYSSMNVTVPYISSKTTDAGSTNWGHTKTFSPSLMFVPVDVILGDLYLEAGRYSEAVQKYCKYIGDNSLLIYPIIPYRYMSENDGGISRFPDLTVYGTSTTANKMNAYDYGYAELFSMNVGSNTAALNDIITYIPMSVSKQQGTVTSIPEAFGYDYYSLSSSSVCPRTDVSKVQIKPSFAYMNMATNNTYYVFGVSEDRQAENSGVSYPDTVIATSLGDGRSNYGNSTGNSYILNTNTEDTTVYYIAKNATANVILYRRSTVYLHLAEALNGLGYPDAAFAILRNGLSKKIWEVFKIKSDEDTTEGEDNTEEGDDANDVTNDEYRYISQGAFDLFSGFFTTYSSVFDDDDVAKEIIGVHNRGGGTCNTNNTEWYGTDAVETRTVNGTYRTAVGSRLNKHYLPEPILDAQLKKLKEKDIYSGKGSDVDYQAAMFDLLSDEYAMEFAFEGSRFYDLQRIARQLNRLSSGTGDKWIKNKLQDKVTSLSKCYLPMK